MKPKPKSKKSFVTSTLLSAAVLLSTVGGAANPVMLADDRYQAVLSSADSAVATDEVVEAEPDDAPDIKRVDMFAENRESMVVGMLSEPGSSLMVGIDSVPDGSFDDGAENNAMVVNSEFRSDVFFSDRVAFTSEKFSDEMLEDNLDADRNDLFALQKEWEEEQERIEEEERLAEEEAEREREREEREEREREREEEREREREEEAEREREAEEAEREEEEREQERSNSSSSSSNSSSSSSNRSGNNASTANSDDEGFVRGSTSDGCGGWGELVEEHFGEREYDKACSVLMCESTGDKEAQNPVSTASGLWQFLDTTWQSLNHQVGAGDHDRAMYATPEEQTEGAKLLRDNYGWSQWVCQ